MSRRYALLFSDDLDPGPRGAEALGPFYGLTIASWRARDHARTARRLTAEVED